jgi:hypothetical protein
MSARIRGDWARKLTRRWRRAARCKVMCRDGRRRGLGALLIMERSLQAPAPRPRTLCCNSPGPVRTIRPARRRDVSPRHTGQVSHPRKGSSHCLGYEGCNNSNESFKISEHPADPHRKQEIFPGRDPRAGSSSSRGLGGARFDANHEPVARPISGVRDINPIRRQV